MNATRDTVDGNGENGLLLLREGQVRYFYCANKPLLHYKSGLLIMQKGLACIAKGAYLLRKCGFKRLFLLHTFTRNCILRTLSVVYGCTPKTHKKRTIDFLMDFSRVLSGSKMQISYHKRLFIPPPPCVLCRRSSARCSRPAAAC